jgi:hypothetical protein
MSKKQKDIIKLLKAQVHNRNEQEYLFAACYINHNWSEDFHDYAISNFLKYFNHLPFWDFKTIRSYIENDRPAQVWLITSNRCQILYNVSINLQEKIIDYQTRISKASSEIGTGISEAINQQITGRGPQQKLYSALYLKSKILDFSLISSPDSTVYFTIPEEYSEQFQDFGELYKIYHDILLITNRQNDIINFLLPDKEVKKESHGFNSHERKVASFTNNHNFICYQYLKQVKSILTTIEIRTLCLNQSFANLGAYLSIDLSSYSETIDYSLLYHLIIKNFNVACSNLPTISSYSPDLIEENNILNKISLKIYEHNYNVLQQIKNWQQSNITLYFDGHVQTKLTELKKQIKDLISGEQHSRKSGVEILIAFDPRYSETSLEKLRVNFSDDSDPMASTNIPSKLLFLTNNMLRLGCQTRTVSGNIEVYPSFIRYLHALTIQFSHEYKYTISKSLTIKSTEPTEPTELNEPTVLLYISNLRTDDSATDIEATIEGHRNRALVNLAEITPGLEVVIMPANRSFLHHQQRQLHDPILILNDVINEITKIILNNGQDFYLSESVRKKLFNNLSREQQYKLIQEWLHEAIHDLYLSDKIPFEISPATRQQIATHFFKYTLTNKLIEKLNPYRLTTPCKDNIDRGAVHTMYYSIIKMIKDLHHNLDNIDKPTDSDKHQITLLDQKIKQLINYDLHSASLLVKGRVINNHNFGLLVHSLTGFMHGPYGFDNSPVFPLSLKHWLEQNNRQSLITSTILMESLADFDSPTSDQDKTEQMELIADDNIAAANRAIFKIPKDTRLPIIVSKSASLIGNAPYLLWYAANTIRTAAMAAGCSVASGFKTLYMSYQYRPELDAISSADELDEVDRVSEHSI